MANGLTTAQRTAFKRQQLSQADFRRTGTLTLAHPSTTIDVAKDIIRWGQTRIQAMNWFPPDLQSDEVFWPTMNWTLNNRHGEYYLDGTHSIWNKITMLNWRARLLVEERVSTGDWVTLCDMDFSVVQAEFNGDEAIITSWHPLARYWQNIWNETDHRDEVDFDGNQQGVRL